MQMLMIGPIKPEWQVKLSTTVILVEHVEGFAEFVDANDVDRFGYLIVAIDELLVDGELDAFALREYSGSAELIILNDAGLKMDFLKQHKNIRIFDQPMAYREYLEDLGILAPVVEAAPVVAGKDECSLEDKPELNLPGASEDKAKKAKKKAPKPEKKVIEKEIEAKPKKSITLPKLPKIEVPKLALSNSKSAVSDNGGAVIISGRQEIGFIGALRGVGTTFAAFYYAKQCAAEKRNVSLVLHDPVEAKVLADVDKHIDVFDMVDLRSALKNDIVVYDFGVLDRADAQLVRDFERCNKRYVVAGMSPFKKHGLNNVLQYANESNLQFMVLFNFVADDELQTIRKTFKGTLECDNLEFINNI